MVKLTIKQWNKIISIYKKLAKQAEHGANASAHLKIDIKMHIILLSRNSLLGLVVDMVSRNFILFIYLYFTFTKPREAFIREVISTHVTSVFNHKLPPYHKAGIIRFLTDYYHNPQLLLESGYFDTSEFKHF